MGKSYPSPPVIEFTPNTETPSASEDMSDTLDTMMTLLDTMQSTLTNQMTLLTSMMNPPDQTDALLDDDFNLDTLLEDAGADAETEVDETARKRQGLSSTFQADWNLLEEEEPTLLNSVLTGGA